MDEGSRKVIGELQRSPEGLSTKELFARIAAETGQLVRKEVAFARAEVSADLRSELAVAKAVGVGVILALCAVNLLFVTLVLALAEVMAAWGAGLLVSGLLLLVTGTLVGVAWRRRVRSPFERTRRHLKEDVRWMKERLAAGA